MSQTKRGPDGRTIGIDGPERRTLSVRRWWAASEGVRYIACVGLLAPAVVVVTAILAR